MLVQTSRRFLVLAGIYAVNQISLFVTFKVSAEIASPAAHVALLSVHSVGTFVAMLADLGYSRPAYRNIALFESISDQANYFVRVNLQRALILSVALPVVLYLTGFRDTSGYALLLGSLYVVGTALRSPWIFASDAFFRFAVTTEFAAGLALIALMSLIYAGVIGSGGYTILAILALVRLAPLLALFTKVLSTTSGAKDSFVLDKDVFSESFVSAGIKIALLFSHYSNSVILLTFFDESQLTDYLHAEKLFYAGLGIFAFTANDLIRLAARGVFRELSWYALAAFVFVAALLGVLVLTQLTGLAVTLVFSEAYASAATTLNWMLAGFPFVAANIVIANAYASTRQYDGVILRCTAIASMANVAVVAWAVTARQPNLAALGVVASEALGSALLSLVLLRNRHAVAAASAGST